MFRHMRAVIAIFFPFHSSPHYPSLSPSKLIISRVAHVLTALVQLCSGGSVDRRIHMQSPDVCFHGVGIIRTFLQLLSVPFRLVRLHALQGCIIVDGAKSSVIDPAVPCGWASPCFSAHPTPPLSPEQHCNKQPPFLCFDASFTSAQ